VGKNSVVVGRTGEKSACLAHYIVTRGEWGRWRRYASGARVGKASGVEIVWPKRVNKHRAVGVTTTSGGG